MKKNEHYSAIANLRVIAIVAIMLNHAQFGIQSNTDYSIAYLVYGQAFKFGSLLFMIISGFLFQKSIHKYSTSTLLKKKFSTILIPSLLFMFPWIILNIFVFPQIGDQKVELTMAFAGNELYKLFFGSIYWFPINLFIILIINSFIRTSTVLKYLIVPAILITLFYSINIYYHWVPRKHNSAMLAYFSFFFAGRFLNLYYGAIRDTITALFKKRNVKIGFALGIIVFFSLSVFESFSIQKEVGDTDPNNILRVSNIVYTMLFMIVLFKLRYSINASRFFQDKSVFLIYLIHPYFLFVGKQLAFRLDYFHQYHTIENIPVEILSALIILGGSLLVARILLKNKLFNAIISGEIVFGKKPPVVENSFKNPKVIPSAKAEPLVHQHLMVSNH